MLSGKSINRLFGPWRGSKCIKICEILIQSNLALDMSHLYVPHVIKLSLGQIFTDNPFGLSTVFTTDSIYKIIKIEFFFSKTARFFFFFFVLKKKIILGLILALF